MEERIDNSADARDEKLPLDRDRATCPRSAGKTNQEIRSAVLVSSASLVSQLSLARIPPNYIGVRRIRPSSRGVVDAKLQQDARATTLTSMTVTKTSSDVVFKITDENGKERRMTRKEKKALKQKLALEKKQAKKRSLAEMSSTSSATVADISACGKSHGPAHEQENLECEQSNTVQSSKRYHQLSIDPTALEQELAELRGDRGGLPPALLSFPMALRATNILPEAVWPTRPKMDTRTISSSCNDKINVFPKCSIRYDDELSQEWATALKASMVSAESVRAAEDMRPMAYQLMPEPWTRLRPPSHFSTQPISTKICPDVCQVSNYPIAQRATNSTKIHSSKQDWSQISFPTSSMDLYMAVVFEYLHRNSHLHLSCGAKFGSDLLIYDGPREERHAFAGLRVLPSKNTPLDANEVQSSLKAGAIMFPLPTAYSLAGYVRCLNTAGKLALLATVVPEYQTEKVDSCRIDETKKAEQTSELVYRVALVDVALEKILTAPTHQRHARTKKRRDVSKNLAKK